MTLLDTARLFIYRCHEKGLEVLMINNAINKEEENWFLPQATLVSNNERIIELDGIRDEQGNEMKAYAIEADWHDIPSIRGMIKNDVKMVKSKLKASIIELEQGSYFDIKDAFKRVLPNEYKALKELKDIILDRNALTNM
ncbi:MAG: hypothetical protein HKN09_14075 [Saprospiraceae bacterium]|nr:hypothetical protein [Saprospiraceae bacterium]